MNLTLKPASTLNWRHSPLWWTPLRNICDRNGQMRCRSESGHTPRCVGNGTVEMPTAQTKTRTKIDRACFWACDGQIYIGNLKFFDVLLHLSLWMFSTLLRKTNINLSLGKALQLLLLVPLVPSVIPIRIQVGIASRNRKLIGHFDQGLRFHWRWSFLIILHHLPYVDVLCLFHLH